MHNKIKIPTKSKPKKSFIRNLLYFLSSIHIVFFLYFFEAGFANSSIFGKNSIFYGKVTDDICLEEFYLGMNSYALTCLKLNYLLIILAVTRLVQKMPHTMASTV
jgi:hypothetical protein